MKKGLAALLASVVLLSPSSLVHAQITQQLFYGNSSSQVMELQTDLKSLGFFNNTATGYFGNVTYNSVKSFQTSAGVNTSGNLDFVTLNKLNKALASEPSVLTYGVKHDRVSELQTYLHDLGYLSVLPTGFYGSLTTSAVSNFQKDSGLAITGNADSALFTALYNAIDKKYAPYTTYSNYAIVSGDNTWSIAIKFGITQDDLLKANNLTASSVLYPGQTLKIPKVNIPVKSHYYKYGEYLDWFTATQYVFSIGTKATVIDYFSGKSFNIERTIGSGHADCETLTAQDTAVMNDVFGGKWSWEDRPILLIVNGRQIAASIAGMPHAGLDAYAANINVDNRSGNYGYGPNYDYIKGNGMDGHFDVHFLGSLRHVDWQLDPTHQAMVRISANR